MCDKTQKNHLGKVQPFFTFNMERHNGALLYYKTQKKVGGGVLPFYMFNMEKHDGVVRPCYKSVIDLN